MLRPSGGLRLYIHQSPLSHLQGDEVSFDIVEGSKGPEARVFVATQGGHVAKRLFSSILCLLSGVLDFSFLTIQPKIYLIFQRSYSTA